MTKTPLTPLLNHFLINMSRKRHKVDTAEVLAYLDKGGEYQVVPKGPKPEPMYRTLVSSYTHGTPTPWYPLTGIPAGSYTQYWNHVDVASLNSLNKVPVGTGQGARVGNKISVSKVRFRTHFDLGHYYDILTSTFMNQLTVDDVYVRCVLLLDQQSSLGDIDIIEDPPFLKFDATLLRPEIFVSTHIKPSNTRFRILHDETQCVKAEYHAIPNPGFTLVNGNGQQTTDFLYKRYFGSALFDIQHTFKEPLTMTYGLADGNPRDNRFVLLWTIGQYNSGYNQRSILTTTSARMYYTDA